MKSVHWRLTKRLSYIEDARCLKVNIQIICLLKHIKSTKSAPTYFGSRRNNHQGAEVSA